MPEDGGQVTVKVVPDVSGIEPAIRAELERISSKLGKWQPFKGEVTAVVLAASLCNHWHETGGDWHLMAEKMQEDFVITRRGGNADDT